MEMCERTKKFALAIIDFTESLPSDKTSDVIGKQLLRCGTSVGANYRATRRAKSKADFISKLGTVEEEADECMYWLELLSEKHPHKKENIEKLRTEANEITSIIVASIKTARQ